MLRKLIVFWLATAFAVASFASSGLVVDISQTRSTDDALALSDRAVRLLNRNFVQLSRKVAGSKFLTLPTTVRFIKNSKPIPPPSHRGRGDDLVLVFDTSGPRAFPPDYLTLLQSIFARAKPVMDAIFGSPSVGGEVLVRNYDADIGDRDAVSGGYYVVNNGINMPEIRFPVYEDLGGFKVEVTAINFIHCLLLAYLGPNQYFADAFNEGLVRAATMRIARTPGALPVVADPIAVEQALESTYDVGAFYDWWNADALATRLFVAPNLRNQPLPAGGSTGGVYLLRYQMSGSAWLKVLVEHPGFLREFNSRYYSNPGNYTDSPQLTALAQQTLSAVSGNANVEGQPFAKWFEKQHVLRVANVVGKKLMLQSFPIEGGLAGDDYGVFGIQAHWFETKLNGDESLLQGTSYPIYWAPRFSRISATAQDDVINIALGYGSVVPNFTNSFENAPYRVTVDAPVSDRIARNFLPAGAIATATTPEPRNLYGCIIGGQDGAAYSLSVTWNGGSAGPIAVTNSAFGILISNATFYNAQSVTFNLKQGAATVLSRKVNKSVGPIAVNLYIDPAESTSLNVPKGVSLQGVPIAPYRQDLMQVFGTDLCARYDSAKSKYDIYPDCGALMQGGGYFVRPDIAQNVVLSGINYRNTPIGVALKPGWNIVSNPFASTVSLANLLVVRTTETPFAYADAIGTLIGPDLFGFSRGANDPVSGVPEGGSFSALTTLTGGQAFLIRVLEPNGATLVFSPGGSSSPGREPRAPADSWQIRIEVDGQNEFSDVYIGQSHSATSGYDRAEDSLLPPSIGGMQARLGANLYRDIRRQREAANYSMRIDNLKPGKKYRIRIAKAHGQMPSVTLTDAKAKFKRTYSSSSVYSFTADSTLRIISFYVGAK